MLEWDGFRSFLAIARSRTLSGAARTLGVQQQSTKCLPRSSPRSAIVILASRSKW